MSNVKEKVVYKYKLEILTDIELPRDAKPLKIMYVGDDAYIWFLLDPTANKIVRQFIVMPTGVEFDATNTQYIDTFFTKEGFVFHVFEKRTTPSNLI